MELNEEIKLTIIPDGEIHDVKEKTFKVGKKRFRYNIETKFIYCERQTKIHLIDCKTCDDIVSWIVGNKHPFFDELIRQRDEYCKEQRRKYEEKRKQFREKLTENKRNSTMTPYEFRKEVYNQTGYILTYNTYSSDRFNIYGNPENLTFNDKGKIIKFKSGTYICSVEVNREYNQNGIQKVIDRIKKHHMKPYLETIKAIEAL